MGGGLAERCRGDLGKRESAHSMTHGHGACRWYALNGCRSLLCQRWRQIARRHDGRRARRCHAPGGGAAAGARAARRTTPPTTASSPPAARPPRMRMPAGERRAGAGTGMQIGSGSAAYSRTTPADDIKVQGPADAAKHGCDSPGQCGRWWWCCSNAAALPAPQPAGAAPMQCASSNRTSKQ